MTAVAHEDDFSRPYGVSGEADRPLSQIPAMLQLFGHHRFGAVKTGHEKVGRDHQIAALGLVVRGAATKKPGRAFHILGFD